MTNNNEFKIEKGVPIPTPVGKKKRYHFESMEIGDSVFLAGKTQATTSHAAKKTGFKFTVRRMDGGIRVWRIE